MQKLSDRIYENISAIVQQNLRPKYLYLGHEEYKTLLDEKPFGWWPGAENIQGLVIIRVSRDSHFHIA